MTKDDKGRCGQRRRERGRRRRREEEGTYGCVRERAVTSNCKDGIEPVVLISERCQQQKRQ